MRVRRAQRRAIDRRNRGGRGRRTAVLAIVIVAMGVLAPVGTRGAAAQSDDGRVAVVVNGWHPTEAGIAAPLAGRLNAVLLYASRDSLGRPTTEALAELEPSRVVLLGSTESLSDAVQTEVRTVLPNVTVERFVTGDAVETAARAALSPPAMPAGRPVVIANGTSAADAGVAAPLASSLGGSVLFSSKTSLGAPTVAALLRLRPSSVVIVGGTDVLSVEIEADLGRAAPGVPIERLHGIDRSDTSSLGAALVELPLASPS